jgi:enoyl-CoA hydratase/carnithine racemase
MTEPDILTVEYDVDLVVLTINRPPANALNAGLIALLLDRLRGFASQPSPPGVVLTGAGHRFFSAGGDIKEVAGPDVAVPRMRDFHAALCELDCYPAPLVCAVRGYAVGGALEFLLHADYVVASDDCRVGFPEINNGLLPAAKGMRQAAQRLGLRAARRLLYTGDLVNADEALQIGAVDELVPSDEVLDRARSVCRDLRQKDDKLFAAIKRSLNLTASMDDQELERMTIEDLEAYLNNPVSSEARARFLTKGAKRA